MSTCTIEKNRGSQNFFSWKENIKKCASFDEQKGARYIRGSVYYIRVYYILNVIFEAAREAA